MTITIERSIEPVRNPVQGAEGTVSMVITVKGLPGDKFTLLTAVHDLNPGNAEVVNATEATDEQIKMAFQHGTISRASPESYKSAHDRLNRRHASQ